jgi:hypothetical protein
VAGGDEHLHAGLLAAGRGAHTREHVHPDHALLLDEVCPGHRVAGRSDEHAEAALHLGIGLAQLLDGLHDLHGIGLDLRRDHDVRAEDTVGLLGLFKHAGEHFLEDGHIVIGGLGVCLLAEVFKDDGVGLAGRGGKCAAQAETASVGRRDAQAGDRIRTHAGLDDGVFEPDKLGKSGFDHDVFLLSNAVYDRQCAGMLPF